MKNPQSKEAAVEKTATSLLEAEWVRQARSGDREAFGRLVEAYQVRAVNTAYYMLNHYEDAVDVAQEAFLRAFKSIRSFRGESGFGTWLFRIVTNTAFSLASRRRTKKRAHRAVSIDQSHNPLELVDAGLSPEKAVENQEIRSAVERAIAALPAEHRAAVVLRDIEGLSYESIAEVLNTPVGTVKSRVHRGRLLLRDRLRGQVT